MKLLDLLVKELPELGGWPDGVTHIEQDYDRELMFYGRGDVRTGIILNELAIDHRKCGEVGEKITRAQYEAALAASKAVVGHNGWIQWAGGECPVDSDAIVEVKYRNPSLNKFNNDRAGDFYWAHTGGRGDIIAYRVHNQDINSLANDDRLEQDLNECIGQDVDVQEWNGEGLPPIGTICEAKVPRSITGWEWREVKVVESGTPGAEKEVLVYDLETTFPSWADEFRPLRTEAEKLRDEAGLALYHAINWNAEGEMVSPSRMEDYKKAYDAIAAGKIPGVKLEGK